MADPVLKTRIAGGPGTDQRPETIAGLFKEIRDQTILLMRQEVALAKAELSEKTNRLIRNLVYLLSGILATFAGFIFVLHALTAGIGKALNESGWEEQSGWLAPLIVAIVVIAGSSFCVKKGISTIKNESLVPEKTLDSLKEDKEWMQGKVS